MPPACMMCVAVAVAERVTARGAQAARRLVEFRQLGSIQAANLHSHYSNCTGGSSRGQQAVCAHERTRGQEECVACLLNHLQRALLWGQLGVHFQVPLQGRGGLKTERD